MECDDFDDEKFDSSKKQPDLLERVEYIAKDDFDSLSKLIFGKKVPSSEVKFNITHATKRLRESPFN